jgi:hypothetical protein
MNRKSCNMCSCTSTAPYICGLCEFRYYCSKKCQNEDWPHHKLTCDKTFHKQIENYVKNYIRHSNIQLDDSKTINLWYSSYINIYSRTYKLQIGYAQFAACHCSICSQVIPNLSVGTKRFSFPYRDNIIEGIRCSECIKMDKMLCPKTFMDTQICTCISNKMINLIFCLKYYDIYVPTDIVILIGNILKRVCCCL